VADRVTRDALLRLRRLAEEDARRSFAEAQRRVREAQKASERSTERLENSRVILERAKAAKSRAQAAGQRAARELFLSGLRDAVEVARASHRSASRGLQDAELSYEKSRAALEWALRAREAAETQESDRKATERRLRSRREDSAAGDRWRKR
jgi:hypothetical protein